MQKETPINIKHNHRAGRVISGMRRRIPGTYLGLIFAVLAIGVFLSIASPYFLNVTNFINIGNQIAINIIIATGMTIIICSGGIDLSVGSNVALTGVIVAQYFYVAGSSPLSIFAGVLVGIGIGAAVGLLNGMFVAVLKIPPFITTLGTMGVVRGLALVFSGGRPLMGMPDNFLKLASGFIGGVPKSVIVAAVTALIGAFLLKNTTLGRFAKAMGGNERCVLISGINTKKYKTIIYTLGGVLAAISGIALTSMMATAEPIAGTWYELDAIAVVVWVEQT